MWLSSAIPDQCLSYCSLRTPTRRKVRVMEKEEGKEGMMEWREKRNGLGREGVKRERMGGREGEETEYKNIKKTQIIYHVTLFTTILSKFIHQPPLPADWVTWWVMVAAPAVPKLMASD